MARESMTHVRFDHFLTYTNAANIDNYLEEYTRQGFIPHEETVRHDPGLRNGFIGFGPEYIEFCWVEDEALFAAVGAEEKLLRRTPRPFGIGMVADDVQAVHDSWVARGYSVPEVWSKAPRDAPFDSPPIWSFQDIPNELLPGAACFVLTYHTRRIDEVKQVKLSPNTSYAISGVTFVTAEPEARATCWRNLLAPGEQLHRSGTGFHIWIGPHQARWITPELYQISYGLDWLPFAYPIGEMGLLHLLASDLRVAKRMLEQAGRQTFPVSVRGEEELLIAPDARDGFSFIIRQRPIEVWLRERTARTDEKLKLGED